MYSLGVICSKNFVRETYIQKLLARTKAEYGPTARILGGGVSPGNLLLKKYTLHYGLQYLEYNPSYTGKNIYSAMPDDYYGKSYHPTHLRHRYIRLIQNSDAVIFFVSDQKDVDMEPLIKYAKKLNKKVVVCD